MSMDVYERAQRAVAGRRMRRFSGTCMDCGHTKPVRWIRFWLGLKYRVCEACERPYWERSWPISRDERG